MSNVARFELPSLIVSPTDAFEALVSLEGHNFGVRTKHNGGCFLDAPDQITRHGVGQSSGTHQQMNLLGGLRQKNRGLPSRVSPADHDHFFSAAKLRFDEGGGVINAGALKARELLDL